MEQITIAGIELDPSPFDASGGKRSKGRAKLLKILQTKTETEVAREVRCSPEFISMLACGRRKPGSWRLMDRILSKLKIARDSWEDQGSLLAESILDRQLQLDELIRYERSRIAELGEQVTEHTEQLAALEAEKEELRAMPL